MASYSYDEVRKDLYSQIHRRLERSEITDKRFAKIGTAKEILSSLNLEHFFYSLVPSGESLEGHFGLGFTADALISRTEERNLQNFLAILIYARCTIESAQSFVTKLVISSEYDGLNQLPAGRKQLEHVFGKENAPDINSFVDAQPCFCPVVLYEGEHVQVADGKNQRLPYVSNEERVGEGSYGAVYRVVIAKGHLANRHDSMANTKPKPMARKDFRIVHDAQKEWETMKHILRAPRNSKNILVTFGFLQLDKTTFSLFMPLAECDLGVWMKKNPPKFDLGWKADILMCMSGVADGLEFLHSGMKDSSGSQIVCFHLDLKPANILVFSDDGEQKKMVWKISDFGISRVKLSHHQEPTDISTLFEERGTGTSVSGTVSRRPGGSYLAPEANTSKPKMSQRSDVWSLGCVVSVIVTYLSEGQSGVDKYAKDRSAHSGYDYFFFYSKIPRAPKPHPSIHKQHMYLAEAAKRRNLDEGKLLQGLMKYIENHVLQLEADRRDTAGSICKRLRDASFGYGRLRGSHERDESHAPGGGSSNPFSRLMQRILYRQKPDTPNVEMWLVSDIKDVAGCSLAPGKFTMACWTNTRIFLYNLQSFQSSHHAESIVEYELKGWEWKSVKLSTIYLIASTIGQHPDLYLFDLIDRGLPVPNFNTGYRIVLPTKSHNGIHRIAISPGGKSVACVVDEDAENSYIYHANIVDLLEHRIQRRGSEATSSSTDEPKYIVTTGEPWKCLRIGTQGANVTHLSFPSDTTLCYVAQPYITDKHDIEFYCISTVTNKSISQPIENSNSSSSKFDSGNPSSLFTTFARIGNEQKFAIVLHERQLFIEDFNNSNLDHQSQEASFGNYWIIKLLPDKKHSRLFALGTKSGSYTILLMELPLPPLKHKQRPTYITTLSNIRYGDKFTAELFKDDSLASEEVLGGGYVMISVYGAGQPKLYKIDLPDPNIP